MLHYHRRCFVSLLSSAWGQVGPKRYCHQANLVLIRSLSQLIKIWKMADNCLLTTLSLSLTAVSKSTLVLLTSALKLSHKNLSGTDFNALVRL